MGIYSFIILSVVLWRPYSSQTFPSTIRAATYSSWYFFVCHCREPAREDPKVVMVIWAKLIIMFKFNSGYFGMDVIIYIYMMIMVVLVLVLLVLLLLLPFLLLLLLLLLWLLLLLLVVVVVEVAVAVVVVDLFKSTAMILRKSFYYPSSQCHNALLKILLQEQITQTFAIWNLNTPVLQQSKPPLHSFEVLSSKTCPQLHKCKTVGCKPHPGCRLVTTWEGFRIPI